MAQPNLKYLIICLFIFLIKVNSMSIKGPALTRYDPCGLGLIYFDKITQKLWQGVMHFCLYSNLPEVVVEVRFENQVKIYGASQNTTITVSDNWHNFTIQPSGVIPKIYKFFLALDNLQANDSDVPVVSEFKMNNVTLCSEDIKNSQTVESLNVTKSDDTNYRHVCGRRSLDHTELVSIRTEAKSGDWPWHVAIFIKDLNTTEEEYYCGGNIISRTAIVTAGHCVRKNGIRVEPNRITVVAGVSNRKDKKQIGRQILLVERVILHPSYTDALATADLAVIKVEKIRYTKYVQPICIWGPVYDKDSLYGQQATVVGFGQTEVNKPSNVLRSTYTVIQNDTTCIDFSPGVYQSLLNEFTFCAGYGPSSNINPRNGDSGGGLVLAVLQSDHKLSWFLRGVLSKCGVSPGQTDCDPTYYVVYTDVGPHYGWIYHHSGLQFTNNIL